MREDLDRIVNEMVDRGVHFDDAQREFERRFIARVVSHCDGNVGKAAEALGMHRNTLTRKVTALKIKVRRVPAA
jgi:DNA-binding NtrC family response regulator